MRILWHSNAPWIGTGYGQQTAIWAPRLASLGHEVAISAFYGLAGMSTQWGGLPVFPQGAATYGNDVVAGYAKGHLGPDLDGSVITLCDVWVLDPFVFKKLPTVCWMPIDCQPLSAMDARFLHSSGAVPVAVSRHGERMLTEAGLPALYVPHGIDTSVFAPADDPGELREQFGIPRDAFVIGINAANKGSPSRKAFSQQMDAFGRLRAKHSDAVLWLHTEMVGRHDGINLHWIADSLDLPEGSVRYSDQAALVAGEIGPEYLAAFYNACDLVSNASMGEGFGLPIIEAQACNTPVVVTDASAMPEVCGAGWVVSGDRWWSQAHAAWWRAPDIGELTDAYLDAYNGAAGKFASSNEAREFALHYDADRILTEHWKPVLELLGQAREQAAAETA